MAILLKLPPLSSRHPTNGSQYATSCTHAGAQLTRQRRLTCRAVVNVLVPIANGSEEIEAVCIIDVLRRAGEL